MQSTSCHFEMDLGLLPQSLWLRPAMRVLELSAEVAQPEQACVMIVY